MRESYTLSKSLCHSEGRTIGLTRSLAARILANEKQRQASAEWHPLKRIGRVHDSAEGLMVPRGRSGNIRFIDHEREDND